MEAIFLKIFNMSLAAGWLIGAVLLLRLCLKQAPKWIRGILWAVVAVRLICPFSLESTLSLIPNAQPVAPEILYAREPAINSGVPVIDRVVNPIITHSFAPNPATSANPLQIWSAIAGYIWILGMTGMLLYALISYIRLRRRVRTSLQIRDNVWICDDIHAPFLLGVINPKIYLPSAMPAEQQPYVIAHEQAHLLRRDHWWKPLGFAVLMLHWFNPLVWVAYILLCRDIELACDEKVVKRFSLEDKKAYSKALLQCSVSRTRIAACPLAFGEVGVKERVKNVLSYKKPALWIILAGVLVSAALAVCFLTDPIKAEEPQQLGASSGQANSDDVTLTAMELFWKEDRCFVKAELYNGRKQQIQFGAAIFLYRNDVCMIPEDTIWDAMAYVLEPDGKTEILLDLSQYGCDQPGEYRLEKEYFLNGVDKAMKVSTEWSLNAESIEKSKKPTLTLDDVIRLSKQKELTSGDFAGYRYMQIGSGLDIWRFEIDELFYLNLWNAGTDEPPMGVRLYVRDGSDASIDICTENVKAFIKKHRNNLVVPELLRGYVRIPVGDSQNVMEKIQQLGAPWAEPGPQEVLPFYPVQSVEDLQRFREEVEPLFDYSRCPEGYYTFPDLITYDGYDETFFDTKEVIVTYYSGRTGQDSPEVRYARQCDGNQLRICVTAADKEYLQETMGWILCIELDKGTLASSQSTKVLVETVPPEA